MSNIRCPKCGTEIPAGKSFCPNCGTNVQTAGATQSVPRAQPQRRYRSLDLEDTDDFEDELEPKPAQRRQAQPAPQRNNQAPQRRQSAMRQPPPQFDDDDEDEVELGYEDNGEEPGQKNPFAKLGNIAKDVGKKASDAAQRGKEKLKEQPAPRRKAEPRYEPEDEAEDDFGDEPPQKKAGRAPARISPEELEEEMMPEVAGYGWNELCLLSAFLCLIGSVNILFSIAAIIIGVKGRAQALYTGEKGAAFAKAVMIIGIIQIVALVVVLVVFGSLASSLTQFSATPGIIR